MGIANSRAEILGKALRAFELRRRLRRPEHLDACRVKIVGKPGDERRLGSDDDKADVVLGTEADNGRVIGDVERVTHFATVGNPGVAGRTIELAQSGAARQGQAKACSRPPEPMRRTFMGKPPPFRSRRL